MSKSLGNLVFVGDLVAMSEAAAVRLALLSHHYRSDWEFGHEDIARAQARLATWRTTMTSARTSDVLDEVRAALDDDLSTPRALEAIDMAAQSGYQVQSAAALLGVTL
jgi:L-cysteine:1D-myo-inositol 2-amino-2-deoxy-alpha-D-glucopyranoside ligase